MSTAQPITTSILLGARRRLIAFWRDDNASASVEYAALSGLGALGAAASARTLGHSVAHTFDTIARILTP